MQIKHLITSGESERAVSPVIGVILMVAITVILAAVIGTFVLGLGDQVQQTSPNAQWDWEQGGPDDDKLNVTHEGGDSVTPTNLEVTGDNTADAHDCNQADDWDLSSGEEVTAGTTCTDVTEGSSPDTVQNTYRLIWTAEGGGSSSTLSTYEAN